MLTEKTAILIKNLANKYENKEFLLNDPSQFMHRYSSPEEQEIAAFIAANMSFGRREQIISKTESIFLEAGKNLFEWVQNRKYKKFFSKGENSFYRMFSHNDFILFFDSICYFLEESGSIGKHFYKIYNTDTYLAPLICNLFPKNCHLIPHSKTTAAKRINMFLRWMVRDNSPVDLGLWKNWNKKNKLLLPLDTHVMQEATNLDLINLNKNGNIPSANIKTCIELTKLMLNVFPEDPCRADYALFGLGVDKNHNS